MKRCILLVDDEVAVLLTMKAVLEISGFEVHTAASAREGKAQLRKNEYQMVITDMRMENDVAGQEVIYAARTAPYMPAIALLTAFPVDEGDWQDLGADQLLLKPLHTRVLLEQIEKLFVAREKRLAKISATPVKPALKRAPAKRGPVTVKKSAKKSLTTPRPTTKAKSLAKPAKAIKKAVAKRSK